MARDIQGILALCVIAMCMGCPNYRFSVKDQFMQDLNAKRQQEDLPALIWDDELGNAAASYNQDCRASGGFEYVEEDCRGNTVGVIRVYIWRDMNQMVDYIHEKKRFYMSGIDSDFQGALYNTMFNDQASKVGCSLGADPGCKEEDFLYCATDVYVPYVIKNRNEK